MKQNHVSRVIARVIPEQVTNTRVTQGEVKVGS